MGNRALTHRPRRLRCCASHARTVSRGRPTLLQQLESRVLFSAYLVTRLDDPVTLTPGTLRWAMEQAVADAGNETITFDPSVTGTLLLSQGELDITGGNLSIIGPGATLLTIDAAGVRALDISANVTTAISGLTFTDASDNSITATAGNLTISNSTFADNSINSALALEGVASINSCTFTSNAANGNGAALATAAGNITIVDSTFTSNSSGTDGGCIDNDGGTIAISNSTFANNSAADGAGAINIGNGSVSIANSSFASNLAAGSDGGAITDSNGNLTIANTTFTDNQATAGFTTGGAISDDAGTMTITASTFIGNNATDSGGAIAGNAPTVTVTTSTFSQNFVSDSGSEGGAIGFNGGTLVMGDSALFENSAQGNQSLGGAVFENGATFTLFNDTLASNSSGYDGGAIGANAGSITLTNDTLVGNVAATLGGGIYSALPIESDNTIIASNTNADCGSALATDSANNLIGDGTGNITTAHGNLLGTSSAPLDPQILGLSNTGGLTLTAAIASSSPAVNAGNNTLAVDDQGNALTTDQRGAGHPRILGHTVDIGAYEAAGSTTQLFISAAYLSILNRAVDPAALTYWSAQAAAGQSDTQIAAAIAGSTEYEGDEVNAIYQEDLHRAADSAGLAYWIGQLQHGTSPDTVRASILGSAEFFTDSRGSGATATNTTFVTALYSHILSRAPDGGLTYWTGLLDTGTDATTQVAAAFLQTDESHGDTISADFETFLARTPTSFELTYFDSLLDANIAQSSLIATFVGSPEFLTLHDIL
jgi:hypothetical protein